MVQSNECVIRLYGQPQKTCHNSTQCCKQWLDKFNPIKHFNRLITPWESSNLTNHTQWYHPMVSTTAQDSSKQRQQRLQKLFTSCFLWLDWSVLCYWPLKQKLNLHLFSYFILRSSNSSAAIPGRIVTDSRSGLSGIAGGGVDSLAFAGTWSKKKWHTK